MSNLDKIKKNQIINLCIGIVFSVLAVFVLVCKMIGFLEPKDSSVLAALVGGAVGALASYFKRRRILCDKDKTEKLLNKTYDERILTIYLHTARTTLTVVGYVGIAVACVFAYINKTVFITLMWTLCSGLLIYMLCYLFYKKKY